MRQAVVIIHGMGEQRPLETLNGFIAAGLAPDGSGTRFFYSRPDIVTGAHDSRRYLAPRRPRRGGPELNAQTEYFEYHWSHHMHGNRFNDLLPMFKRILLQPPQRVPSGLRVVWALFWAFITYAALALWSAGLVPRLGGITFDRLIRTFAGTGAVAVALVYLLTRMVPRWLTASFVDVVRYLDTSPRSYEIRMRIRAGIVDLLRGLHQSRVGGDGSSPRYDRIVVVAHSLGGFIGYDGITALWAQMNKKHTGPGDPATPVGLAALELAASEVAVGPSDLGGQYRERLSRYQHCQGELWKGLRAQGNPWRITDFITLGTPMYFADRLYTKNAGQFKDRVSKRELPTCPPQHEGARRNNIHGTTLWYSWEHNGRRVLYHGAPFAVVRWTNMWFPARWGFFGDWFAGPLAPLYGAGIQDIPVTSGPRSRYLPGYAHTRYFKAPKEEPPSSGSVTEHLRDAMALASTEWLVAPPTES